MYGNCNKCGKPIERQYFENRGIWESPAQAKRRKNCPMPGRTRARNNPQNYPARKLEPQDKWLDIFNYA